MLRGLKPSKILRALAYCLFACVAFAPVCRAQPAGRTAVEVSIVTDEAEAVLSVLSKKRAGQAVTEEDWRRVFASEGYTRLKRREHAMGRSFEDEDFKSFVLSDALSARADGLAETLARWRRADPGRAARLALRYLPRGARIRAKIYPVIKPRDNSFVFDLATDPAIFLYLDPAKTLPQFENTLAHELHHIGYGTVCPAARTREEISRLPQNMQTVLTYARAFGEGFAMLAAAGGPRVHPHATSEPRERARWDRDVANFDADLGKVEKFFLDVLGGRLSGEQVGDAVAPFYGEQGAWYTVGWRMSVTIERVLGRRVLISAMCDPRLLFDTYNRAASAHNRRSRDRPALWSPTLVEAVRATRGRPGGKARRQLASCSVRVE